MKKIVHFETLGCRLNQDETEGAARCFFEAGYECDMEGVLASSVVNKDAVLCVINTCTVTSKAEAKARRLIRLCLQKFPLSCVLVTGCYAELDGKIIKSIAPQKIAVLKGTQKHLLSKIALLPPETLCSAQALENFIHENTQIVTKKFTPVINESFMLHTDSFRIHSRPTLKIQDGCSNSCSFCRIHFARGNPVSLAVREVLRRVLLLEEKKFSEVVLTGINLSQYAGVFESGGSQGSDKIFSFSKLLRYLLENTKRINFRISSLYPQSITEEFLEVISNSRVRPFFHLSVQSGSDSVLSQMKRPYTSFDVLTAVKKIRSVKNDAFISCDMIAGFPGETEADFESTIKLCNECCFQWIHAFPYSPRPGTEAALMPNQVSSAQKVLRVKQLTEKAISEKIKYVSSFIGKKLSCVVEMSRSLRSKKAESDKSDFIYHAVTENYLHVEFKSEKVIEQGSEVFVCIKECLFDSIQKQEELDAKAELI